MKRAPIAVLLILCGLLLGSWLAWSPPVTSQEVSFVRVTNFPPLQEIEGKVEISEPIRLAKMVSMKDILVPPVRADHTTRWVDAGVLETGGFPNVVLSMHGEVKGSLTRRGQIVGVLIPTEQSIVEAFDEEGLVHFSLKVAAAGPQDGVPYFASDQPRFTVVFASYRVYLYNETDKTVTANLFAYLTN